MKSPLLAVRAWGTSIAFVLLAGCSGTSLTSAATAPLPAPDANAARTVRPAAGAAGALPSTSKAFKGSVWVSNIAYNDVSKCVPKRCTMVGGGFSGPQGLGVDSKGNVYVADTNDSRVVELSPAGQQIAILSDAREYPVSVTIARDGTVAVGNVCSAPRCRAGSVAFYAPGATSPTYKVSGVVQEVYFLGFDKKGDLYFDGIDNLDVTHVGLIKAGTRTGVDTGLSIGFPGSVEIGDSDRLLNLGDQSCGCIQQYSLPGLESTNTVTAPPIFSLAKGDTALWAMNGDQVSEYAFPGGGSPIYSIEVPGGSVVAVPTGTY